MYYIVIKDSTTNLNTGINIENSKVLYNKEKKELMIITGQHVVCGKLCNHKDKVVEVKNVHDFYNKSFKYMFSSNKNKYSFIKHFFIHIILCFSMSLIILETIRLVKLYLLK